MENLASKLVDKETNKKYYFIDNGILNLFLIDPNTFLLENMVAIQLRRLYGDQVYYYSQGMEVDFVLWESHVAIQVSYSIHDRQTREREIKGLLSLPDNLKIVKMLIITKDEGETIEEDGKTIEVVPIWKWLIDGIEE